MCTFVTASVPAKTDLKRMEPLLKEFGFTLEFLAESRAARRLGPSETYFRLASGYCCDASILGCKQMKTKHASGDAQERKIQELRKTGWSESRIARWLQETEKKNEAWRQEDEKAARRWIGFIQKVLTEGAARALGLIVHEYGGSLTDADLPKGKPVRVLLKTLTPDRLETMEDGVLYRFVLGDQ